MNKKICGVLALLGCAAMLGGCAGNGLMASTAIDPNEVEVAEASEEMQTTQKAEKTAVLDGEVISISNPPVEQKRAELSEEEFNEWMDKRGKLLIHPWVGWNPETENYETVWSDEEISDYVEARRPESQKQEYREVELPAELTEAIETLSKTQEKTLSQDPNYALSSASSLAADTSALTEFAEKYAVEYFDKFYEYAAYSIHDPKWSLSRECVNRVMDCELMFLTDLDAKTYQEAAEAVRKAGEGITKEDVQRMAEEYGWLIAAPLRDAGKLDLLEVPADALCTDKEKLADFAQYFAPNVGETPNN